MRKSKQLPDNAQKTPPEALDNKGETLRTAPDYQTQKAASKRVKTSFFENWTEKFRQFLNDSE